MLAQIRRDSRRYGRCCFVSGEAGIGKSRLINQFLQDLPRGRICVGLGRALEHVRSPFAPWIAAMESAAPATVAVLQENEHAEKMAMYRAALEGLHRCAQRRATILVLEDLQWADAASLELLAFIRAELAGLRRLLIVASVRATDAPNALRTMLSAPQALVVQLGPLDRIACTALVHAMLAHEEAGSLRITRIVEACAGNPFFAEELCRSPDATRIPTSVQAAISLRLARFGERERRVLQSAAVVGERFELALLAKILRLPPGTIANRLEAAQIAGVVVEEPDGLFRFGHALTRAVLMSTMTAAARIRLHERAARQLEDHRRFDALSFARLAYHYAGAHDRRKAYAYHMRAGDLAYTMHAYRDAAAFYGSASDAAEPGSEPYAFALRRQGDALIRSSAIAEAEAVYRKAVAVYRAAGAAEDAGRIYQSLARSVYNQDRPRDAFALVEEAVATSPSLSGDTRADLDLFGAFCAADFDPELAKTWLTRIPHERVREGTRAGGYYSVLAGIEASLGEVKSWEHTVREFRRHADALPAAGEYVGFYGNLAAQALFLGCNAVPLYERCLLLARSLEMDVYEAAFSSHAAFDRWLHGDMEGFARHARRASAVEASVPALRAYVLLCSLLGDPTFSAPMPEVYAILAGGRNEFFGPLVGHCAWRLAARGETRELRRLLDATAAALAAPYAAWDALVAMAELGSPAVRERAHAMTAPFRDAAAPTFAATAAMVEAFHAHHEGDAPARDRAAEQARTLYESIGWTHYAQRAARLHRGSTPTLFSPRESQIAALLSEGCSNRAMAAELFISEKTVEKHVARVFEKLRVNSRAAAVRALSEGLPQR